MLLICSVALPGRLQGGSIATVPWPDESSIPNPGGYRHLGVRLSRTYPSYPAGAESVRDYTNLTTTIRFPARRSPTRRRLSPDSPVPPPRAARHGLSAPGGVSVPGRQRDGAVSGCGLLRRVGCVPGRPAVAHPPGIGPSGLPAAAAWRIRRGDEVDGVVQILGERLHGFRHQSRSPGRAARCGIGHVRMIPAGATSARPEAEDQLTLIQVISAGGYRRVGRRGAATRR